MALGEGALQVSLKSELLHRTKSKVCCAYATTVLSAEPNVEALGEQRPERHGLGRAEVDPFSGLDALEPLGDMHPSESRVYCLGAKMWSDQSATPPGARGTHDVVRHLDAPPSNFDQKLSSDASVD